MKSSFGAYWFGISKESDLAFAKRLRGKTKQNFIEAVKAAWSNTMNRSLNISDQFTEEGIQKLKKDMLLRFDQEGSITELKITKVNKKSGKVYAKEVKTFTPEEVEAIEAQRGNVKDIDNQN